MDQSVFIHPNAIVEPGAQLGARTRVWAFAHILPEATIGEDCNFCDHVFVENDVIIGDRITIKCGVQIWDGITIENDVFIGPNVTFTNDPFPRSKQYPEEFARTVVRRGASIGANATILPGIIIGQNSVVGAGAVVTSNVPPFAIVTGNPARISGYSQSEVKQSVKPHKMTPSLKNGDVAGVEIYHLPFITDLRGNLSVAEYGKDLPFVPKRYFLVFDVPSKEVRGEHAHRNLHQFLVCVKGSCSIVVDDGHKREEFVLDEPNIGLHIPPMVWATQYKYTPDAMLLVLASEAYDADDYIRDYDEFLSALEQVKSESLLFRS
jgi:acetyltransferase-like isoleucine patch superfamily enzyme/dTDP-4-dehydrorhamnose 3,5-epimerase-like enzyme